MKKITVLVVFSLILSKNLLAHEKHKRDPGDASNLQIVKEIYKFPGVNISLITNLYRLF